MRTILAALILSVMLLGTGPPASATTPKKATEDTAEKQAAKKEAHPTIAVQEVQQTTVDLAVNPATVEKSWAIAGKKKTALTTKTMQAESAADQSAEAATIMEEITTANMKRTRVRRVICFITARNTGLS